MNRISNINASELIQTYLNHDSESKFFNEIDQSVTFDINNTE